ncbi:MAG: mandelate racemase/muconate lactonizing enzyme family protein [Candidatus Lambdaproteobacteria bacterium]|nr:mandelate racemase/muconate lactonizing enzyme family protein [Candidatus Lambdaproteobacteria bacterium]
MKVTSVKHFIVDTGWRKNWVFVKVETSEGITGWGEAYTQYDRDTAVAAQVTELARYLVGRDPFLIKHFTQAAFDDYAQRRGSLEFFCALSGMEAALWDIVGKATGQPVYNLLGGPVRDKIRVYANGWSYHMEQPADYARAAEAVLEKGFTAIKFDPLPIPWRTYIPKEHEQHAYDVVKAVRQAVGPKTDILIEAHRRLAPMHSIRYSNRLAEFEPYWFEEPCQAENLSAMADIRRRTRIPVVTGEAIYTKAGFRPVLEQQAADILNPDVANCGGILELKEIAAMAEPFFVAVSPHNYNSTVLALAATVHAAATMPNFIITEYFVPYTELGKRVSPNCLVPEKGYIALPRRPGLGLDIDEQVLASIPGKQFPVRTLRLPGEEGP